MERFCEYLNEKCRNSNNSIRQIAKLSNITHPYLLELMNGQKSPPEVETQINLAKTLELSEKDRKKFFDLAAKERHTIPADIFQSLLDDEEKWEILRNEMRGE